MLPHSWWCILAKRMRISWPCGECVSCHGLVGNITGNNTKCKRLAEQRRTYLPNTFPAIRGPQSSILSGSGNESRLWPGTYSRKGIRQVYATLLGAHHVPERLWGGSVYTWGAIQVFDLYIYLLQTYRHTRTHTWSVHYIMIVRFAKDVFGPDRVSDSSYARRY